MPKFTLKQTFVNGNDPTFHPIDDGAIRELLNIPKRVPISRAHCKAYLDHWNDRRKGFSSFTVHEQHPTCDENLQYYHVPLWFVVQAGNQDKALELAQQAIEYASASIGIDSGSFGGFFDNESLGDMEQVVLMNPQPKFDDS